ncbi:MAG: hypothetical protein ABW221_12260 [Vicinamibacteria bacterium]
MDAAVGADARGAPIRVPENDTEMAQGLIVRLGDGSEIGPLGRDDLRSWFERGLITSESMVKRPDSARWTTLGQEIDVTLWQGLAAARRSAAPREQAPSPRPAARPPAPAPRPTARVQTSRPFEIPSWARPAGMGALALAVVAGAWVYFTRESADAQRLRAAASAERRFADADAGVALDLPAGWLILRPDNQIVPAPENARLVLAEPSAGAVGYLATENPAAPYASLDAYLTRVVETRKGAAAAYTENAREDAKAGPFAARVLSAARTAGDLAFAERITVWKEAWTYFALVTWTPESSKGRGVRADEALYRGFSSVGQVGQRAQAAMQRVIAEVPHLSPGSVETLMGRSAAGILDPPEVFRRSWDLASRGLPALDKRESNELSNLIAALYARVAGRDRQRLSGYVARVRAREQTKPDEDQAMGAVMKAAVDKLPALQQQRLRDLFEKAIAAGLGRP